MEISKETLIRGPTLWHQLIIDHAPPTAEILTGIQLSQMPRRADLVLIRRRNRLARDREGNILRGLWPHLSNLALVEFKSPSVGYRSGDIINLYSYGSQFHGAGFADRYGCLRRRRVGTDELNPTAEAAAAQEARAQSESSGNWSGESFSDSSEELTLVLITPAETPSFRADINKMATWNFERLGNGYARITGASYAILVAFTDEVCRAEYDEFLRLVSRYQDQTQSALQWLNKNLTRMSSMGNIDKLEGYEVISDRLLDLMPAELVRRKFTPEQIVSQFTPEERLAGLTPEERAILLRELLEQSE